MSLRIYKLTREGRRKVKIPADGREPILDHLYEFKTATRDELVTMDKDANYKLREFIHAGLVMEVT